MNKRVVVVDALRGLSLFGILAANMLIFQYGLYGKDEMEHYSISSFDYITHIVLKVLVESSFMPIFAFLFGYGMIKMKESLENKGLPVKRYLARRFILLFIFGILHSIFLWEGDILTTYGMTGFILLLYVNRKVKTLYTWGIIMLVLMSAMSYGTLEITTTQEEKTIMAEYVTTTLDVYQNGSYTEILSHRMNEDPLTELMSEGAMLFILILAPFFIMPMFLFGMIAAKQQWFIKIREASYLTKWKKLGLFFIISGLVLKMMPFLFEDLGISGVGYALGGPILAFGYIVVFSLLLQNRENFLVQGFISVGRLSLTNYLLQTIICTAIFYGYGIGLFGKLGVLAGIGLTILIYIAQLVGSTYYLRAFKTGPFEKILRIWTYLKWRTGTDYSAKHEKLDDNSKIG